MTMRHFGHGHSRQIKPMSQAELDASLKELEAKAEKERQPGVYYQRMPSGPHVGKYKVIGSGPGVSLGGYEEHADPEGVTYYDTQQEAEQEAQRLSKAFRLTYHGEF